MGDLSENFSRYEFACKCGCGFDTVDAEQLRLLQDLREWAGPTKVNSGCRCVKHNKDEGGGENSLHLFGRASDIECENKTPDEVADWVDRYLGNTGGLGRYETFTHIDTRTNGPARWEG